MWTKNYFLTSHSESAFGKLKNWKIKKLKKKKL